MARTNFSFQKRQKELAKKKKQEEKKQRKLEKKGHSDTDVEQVAGSIDQGQGEEPTGTVETAERPKPGVIAPSQ